MNINDKLLKKNSIIKMKILNVFKSCLKENEFGYVNYEQSVEKSLSFRIILFYFLPIKHSTLKLQLESEEENPNRLDTRQWCL